MTIIKEMMKCNKHFDNIQNNFMSVKVRTTEESIFITAALLNIENYRSIEHYFGNKFFFSKTQDALP